MVLSDVTEARYFHPIASVELVITTPVLFFLTVRPRTTYRQCPNLLSTTNIYKLIYVLSQGQRPCRWFLLPVSLFQPTHNYRLQSRPREDLSLDFDAATNTRASIKILGLHIDSRYCQSCVNSIVHGWKWLGIKNQRVRISILPPLPANCSSIPPQWKIVSAGKGIYYLQCLHENLYVGWEERNLCEGGKVVMSKTPSHWAITTSSSLTHQ